MDLTRSSYLLGLFCPSTVLHASICEALGFTAKIQSEIKAIHLLDKQKICSLSAFIGLPINPHIGIVSTK